ncbi:MAG: glutathione S-transferase family protein [Thermodesulfobacteriota bacterium]
MHEPVRVVGSYASPYVRKVLVTLLEKGIAYEIDPIVPFMGDDRFAALSPLRRVPVLIDDAVALCDSSVICQYLEDRRAEPALYPQDVTDRARARWLEEFADTRMGDVFVWRLFNQLVIRRFVWNEEPDQALVERAFSRPSFATLKPFEKLTLRTPIAEVREALAAAGAPVMRETYGTATPRRGVMPT